MAKQLVITEKPSVARDIVAALGGFTEHDGYWESDEYVVTFSVGHIVELLSPEDVDPIYKRWTLDTLPILPGEFKLKQKQGQSERIRTIKKLLARKDVEGVVNACDAGPRGRADLPRDPRVPRERQADQAPVAAVDDAGLDPQRLPHAGRRLAVRRARRGGLVPLEVGLADRHERDPRADPPPEGPQGEDRLVRRARADADPGDRGGPRARDPGARGAALLAAPREVPDRRPRVPGHLVRPDLHRPRGRGARAARRPDLRGRAREPAARDAHGQAGRGERDAQAEPRDGAAAVRPDEPAARGQPPLRLVRAAHAERGAALLRGAQAPDLSAHRLALPAQRLPRATSTRRSRRSPPTARTRPRPGRSLANGLENTERTFDDAKVSDHFAIIPTGKIPDANLSGDDQRLFDLVDPPLPRQLPPGRGLDPRRARDRGAGPVVPLARAHARRARLARGDRPDRAGRPGAAAARRPARTRSRASRCARSTSRSPPSARSRWRGSRKRGSCL